MHRGAFGSRRWMQHIGELGDSARNAAKAKASRENGTRGGRPNDKRGGIAHRESTGSARDPMRPSVISTTMVQHHVKKPIGEFSLTLASMSAIFYLSVN
jgi:hypothetical protein